MMDHDLHQIMRLIGPPLIPGNCGPEPQNRVLKALADTYSDHSQPILGTGHGYHITTAKGWVVMD